jgi:His/Glu/Gln/Arg/opine family amino acid ABC transporter permease subunit
MGYSIMNLLIYAPLLAKGTLVTLASWLSAAIISLLIGTGMGIISCRYFARTRLIMAIRCYTFIAKGVPAYVQILIAYFVIPAMLGIHVSGFVAAVGALAFCSSGYVTEIIRSGINTIAREQWDACVALGYPLKATLRRIILPQIFRNVLPTLLGEMEQLLKSTALLAAIGVTELTRSGMNIISRELNPIPIYLIIAAIYLVFAAIVALVVIYYERKTYGYR